MKLLNRSVNSSLQLTLGAVWRHTVSVRPDLVSAVATQLSPVRYIKDARVFYDPQQLVGSM